MLNSRHIEIFYSVYKYKTLTNAAKILNNLKNKERIFNQEYYRSFLPQIIIATYYGIINQEIIENQYSLDLDLEKEKEIIFKTNK